MAELPRYKSSGLQVAAPEGQFRDVSAPMDALSKGMNQMTSFFLQSAQEQAVVEGEKYGAENAPSLEQIADARKLNEPLKPVAEQFTYFGRAATETSNRILAKNISADADMALEKLSARISNGEIPINQITSQTNALIQGYSTVLKDINPALGRSVEADLALSGNRMFLAASKAAAAEALAEQQKKVAETVEKTLPSAVAQIFKTGTIEVAGGLTLSVDAQLEIAKSKAQNMINSLPPKQRKAMTEKLDGFIETAAGNSIEETILTSTDSEELKVLSKNIQTGVYKSTIKDPTNRIAYFGKVNTRIAALEQEEERAKIVVQTGILTKIEDLSAMTNAGGIFKISDVPSDSEILSSFSPEKAATVLQTKQTLIKANNISASISTASLDQIDAKIEELKNDITRGPVDQAKENTDLYNTVVQSIANNSRVKELTKEGNENQVEIKGLFKDAYAALAAGGFDTEEIISQLPSDADITSNFRNPKDAQEILAEKEKLVRLIYNVDKVPTMSKEDLLYMINDMGENIPEGALKGTESRINELQIFQTAVEGRQKRFDADPGTYAVKEFSDVQTAYDNMISNPSQTNVQAYVALTTSVQISLGARPENVQLLSKVQADGIVNGFNNQVTSGVNYADYLMTLQDTWGAAFPQVLKQLGKDLPAEVGVVASLNERDRTAAQTLANALQPQNLKALKESVPTDASKLISNAVDTAMVSFRDSLFNSASLNGSVEFAKYNSAVNILAQTYVARGEAPATAAQKAYEKVIGSAYRFGDGYRIPMAVDQNRIITTTSLLLKNIEKYEIQSPVSILGFTPQQAKEQYVSSLVANGRWVNTPDERFGLRLVDQNGSPVMLANGKMFELPWTVLSKEYGGMVTPSGGRGTGARTTEGKFVPPELFP